MHPHWRAAHLLPHLRADTGRLQAVVKVGVALDLDGKGSKVRLVYKRLSLQDALRPTVTSEQLHHWVVAGQEEKGEGKIVIHLCQVFFIAICSGQMS